jgi:hypothetical protein
MGGAWPAEVNTIEGVNVWQYVTAIDFRRPVLSLQCLVYVVQVRRKQRAVTSLLAVRVATPRRTAGVNYNDAFIYFVKVREQPDYIKWNKLNKNNYDFVVQRL